MRQRRGMALSLMIVVLAVLMILASIVSDRVTSNVHHRREDDTRTQALWLARSARDAGLNGTRQVETPYGAATVTALEAQVRVDLSGLRVELR